MSEEAIFQQLEICQKQRDAAQSQLAALREELRQSEIRGGGKSKLIESLNSRLDGANEKCVSLVTRNDRLKWQRNGTRLKLDEAEQRLADAERRNADYIWLLDKVVNLGAYPEKVLHEQITATLAALTKPEEAKS